MKTKVSAFHSITEVKNFFQVINITMNIRKTYYGYTATLPNGFEVIASELDTIVCRMQNYVQDNLQYSHEVNLQFSN